MVRTFERGLSQPDRLRAADPALERRRRERSRWISERWPLRRGKLFLVPGDSPVGFRLPMKSLPWCRRRPIPTFTRRTRWSRAARCPIAAHFQQLVQRAHGADGRAAASSAEQVAEGAVRTALSSSRATACSACSCRRSPKLEDYLELLAAVEETARDRGLPVRIEGYPPPYDPRINVIKVTPDPGVIEVNVHPAASWREAVDDHDRALRGRAPDAARRRQVHDRRAPHRHRRRQSCRARRRRPGRIRRSCAGPTCSRSLVLYWQRHPSLSYLFSGLFIGPTSQAPRLDEARDDSALRTRDRARQCAAAGRAGAAALARRPAVPQPAGRRHRQHASRRNLHRQALFARRPDRAARAGRVPLLRNAARRAHEPRPAIAAARARRLVLARAAARRARCAGARRCTTASCCRISSGQDFLGVLADLGARRLSLSTRNGSRRSANSASPSTAASSTAASSWKSARRSSPGMCWARKPAAAARCAMSIPRSSACRSRRTGLSPGRHVIACNGRALPMTGDRHRRRGGGRRALQGVAAGLRPASDDSRCMRR